MDDLISRQEAIDALNRLCLYPGEWAVNGLDFCKDAIANLPSIDAVPMEKWQELKETVLELRDNGGMATQKEVGGFLLNLMDVLDGEDDAVLTARWIGGEIGHCSCCGHHGIASDIWTGCDDGRFCPNCGARMDGEDNE